MRAGLIKIVAGFILAVVVNGTFSDAFGSSICKLLWNTIGNPRETVAQARETIPVATTLALTPMERIVKDFTGQRDMPGPNFWQDAHTALSAISLINDYPAVKKMGEDGIALARENIEKLKAAKDELETNGTVRVYLRSLPVLRLADQVGSHADTALFRSVPQAFTSIELIDAKIDDFQESIEHFELILRVKSLRQALRLELIRKLAVGYEGERLDMPAELKEITLQDILKDPSVLKGAMQQDEQIVRVYVQALVSEMFNEQNNLHDGLESSPEAKELVERAMQTVDSNRIWSMIYAATNGFERAHSWMSTVFSRHFWVGVEETMRPYRVMQWFLLAVPLSGIGVFSLVTNIQGPEALPENPGLHQSVDGGQVIEAEEFNRIFGSYFGFPEAPSVGAGSPSVGLDQGPIGDLDLSAGDVGADQPTEGGRPSRAPSGPRPLSGR